MRAISQHRFGDPDVLHIIEVDPAEPVPTEVLIRIHAIGLDPIEAKIRRGSAPMLGQPPFILGWDISGVVEDVVPGVNRFRPGDEVFGMPFSPARLPPTPSWSRHRRGSWLPSRARSITCTRRRCL